MRATLRLAALTLCLVAFGADLAAAQATAAAAPAAARTSDTFTRRDRPRRPPVSSAGCRAGWRKWCEKAFSNLGEPNGYVLGQEGSGAFVVGLRYGDGKLYTRNAGDRRVFWEGPSVGFDYGGEGARTMMLVYNLPATDAIYQRFAGIDGSAYFIGGFGMTALDRQPHRGGADPLRRGFAAGRQYRLPQIHRRRRPGTRSDAPPLA